MVVGLVFAIVICILNMNVQNNAHSFISSEDFAGVYMLSRASQSYVPRFEERVMKLLLLLLPQFRHVTSSKYVTTKIK